MEWEKRQLVTITHSVQAVLRAAMFTGVKEIGYRTLLEHDIQKTIRLLISDLMWRFHEFLVNYSFMPLHVVDIYYNIMFMIYSHINRLGNVYFT